MSREFRLTIHAALATALTATGLYPLFVSKAWWLVTLPAIATASGACWVGRRFRLPAVMCALLGAAALLWYLTLVFAGAEATLRVIPDRSSMRRLLMLASAGFEDIGQYTAPVPELAGITLVTAAGVGLVAVLVDLLVLGMRQPAMAGLPLLAIFSVPVAVRLDSIGVGPFLLGATGFVALLLADGRDRLTGWGNFTAANRGRRPPAVRPGPDGRALVAVGRRIAATAMLIALVFPVFIPELPARAFSGGGGLGGLGGTNTIAAPNPMVSLKRDLTLPQEIEVLRYRTDDPTPEYLRIYALDRFDGEEWRMSRLRAGPEDRVAERSISPPGLTAAPVQRTTTEIAVDPNLRDLSFLPLPYPTVRIDISGDWRVHRETLMVFSTSDVATGRTYRAAGLDVNTSRGQLRNAPPAPEDVRERYLGVPPNVPQVVRDLARNVTGDADTDYGRALALQEWFTSGEFSYSLAPQGTSTSALTEFLTVTKTGYCEQFAGSMALLARILGIPARVAVGYTAGEQVGRGEYAVTTHDTHAWPELYFQGAGWLRFEPTPAGPTGQATATVPGYARQPIAPEPGEDAGSASDPATQADGAQTAQQSADPTSRIDAGSPNLGGGSATSTTGERPWQRSAAAVATLAVAVLLLPAVLRRAIRRRRWATARDDSGRARAAWAELRDDAVDLGLTWRNSDSPRGAALRITRELRLPDRAAQALQRMATAEERARYAPAPPDTETLGSDSRKVRRAMADATNGRARLRATLFPRSSLLAVADALRRTGSVVTRLDAVRTRARTRLLPRWIRRA